MVISIRNKKPRKASDYYDDWLTDQLCVPLSMLAGRLRWSRQKINAVSDQTDRLSKKDVKQLEVVMPGAIPFARWLEDRQAQGYLKCGVQKRKRGESK